MFSLELSTELYEQVLFPSLFEIVCILISLLGYPFLFKIFKDNILLDFLHYSVDNLHLEHLMMFCGGDEENRTPDPLLARQVLSQLSYTPTFFSF